MNVDPDALGVIALVALLLVVFVITALVAVIFILAQRIAHDR